MTHLSKTCFPMSTDTFPFELAAALISGCMMCCWVKRASDIADDDQWGTEEAEPDDAAEEEGDLSGPQFCCQPEPGRKERKRRIKRLDVYSNMDIFIIPLQ
jgi:hypothetical protein